MEGVGSVSDPAHDNWFGGKNIGYFAGIALLINNITGPGVPQLPNMFAESGWLLPSITILVIWAMTSLSTVMYAEAMRKVHNRAIGWSDVLCSFELAGQVPTVLCAVTGRYRGTSTFAGASSTQPSSGTTLGTRPTSLPRSGSTEHCNRSTSFPSFNLRK